MQSSLRSHCAQVKTVIWSDQIGKCVCIKTETWSHEASNVVVLGQIKGNNRKKFA